MASTEARSAATTTRLHIEGPMILARAIELRDAILGALSQQCSVELDLSDVTELDSAGVQLLLMAKSAAAARDRELRLVGQSSVVLRTLELLRLDAHFGPPVFFLFDEDSP
jgi:anti-sigma B factor antagonist